MDYRSKLGYFLSTLLFVNDLTHAAWGVRSREDAQDIYATVVNLNDRIPQLSWAEQNLVAQGVAHLNLARTANEFDNSLANTYQKAFQNLHDPGENFIDTQKEANRVMQATLQTYYREHPEEASNSGYFKVPDFSSWFSSPKGNVTSTDSGIYQRIFGSTLQAPSAPDESNSGWFSGFGSATDLPSKTSSGTGGAWDYIYGRSAEQVSNTPTPGENSLWNSMPSWSSAGKAPDPAESGGISSYLPSWSSAESAPTPAESGGIWNSMPSWSSAGKAPDPAESGGISSYLPSWSSAENAPEPAENAGLSSYLPTWSSAGKAPEPAESGGIWNSMPSWSSTGKTPDPAESGGIWNSMPSWSSAESAPTPAESGGIWNSMPSWSSAGKAPDPAENGGLSSYLPSWPSTESVPKPTDNNSLWNYMPTWSSAEKAPSPTDDGGIISYITGYTNPAPAPADDSAVASAINYASTLPQKTYDSVKSTLHAVPQALGMDQAYGSTTNKPLEQLYQVATQYFDTISSGGRELADQFLDASMSEQATVIAIAAVLAYAAYNYKAIITSVKNSVTKAGSWILSNVRSATVKTATKISELFALISLATIKLGHQVLPYSLTSFISGWVTNGISLRDFVSFVGQSVATNQTDSLDSLVALSQSIIHPHDLKFTTKSIKGVEDGSNKVIPDEAAHKIIEQIVRPSVPTFIVEKFLKVSRLGLNFQLLTRMKELCNGFSVRYQAELALIFGKNSRVGALSILYRGSEKIEPKFLTFYRFLIEALFKPGDGGAIKNLKKSFSALKSARLNIGHLHLQLMDLFLREGQCLLSHNLNPTVCQLANGYFQSLVQGISLSGANSPRLAYLQPLGNPLNYKSFFNAHRVDSNSRDPKYDYAILAVAIQAMKSNQEALKGLDCGRDNACLILKKLAVQEPKVADPCGTNLSSVTLVENMPEWIDTHNQLDNDKKEKFVAGLIYALTGIHPDSLPKWVYYKQSLADAFNNSIQKYCADKNLRATAAMNHL